MAFPALRPNPSRGAFSRIECIASIAALALLAGILAPAVLPPSEARREEQARADMASVARAFQAYFVDTGRWPSNGMGPLEGTTQLVQLPCLFENVHALQGWKGPYLQGGCTVDAGARWIADEGAAANGSLRDPWGRNYLIHTAKSPEGSLAVQLLSRGCDGRLDVGAVPAGGAPVGGDDLHFVITRGS